MYHPFNYDHVIYGADAINARISNTKSIMNLNGTEVWLFDDLVVKGKGSTTLQEAYSMMLVKENTTVPVPEIYACYKIGKVSYIVMQRIKGESLDHVVDKLDDNELKSVYDQLHSYVKELRRIGSDFYGRVDRTPFSDLLLFPKLDTVFTSYEDFVQYWISRYEKHIAPTSCMAMRSMLLSCPNTPVLVHGDLVPSNIMVDGSKIVAIIDWATAGFYPMSWEYLSAFMHDSRNRRTVNMILPHIHETPLEFMCYKEIIYLLMRFES